MESTDSGTGKEVVMWKATHNIMERHLMKDIQHMGIRGGDMATKRNECRRDGLSLISRCQIKGPLDCFVWSGGGYNRWMLVTNSLQINRGHRHYVVCLSFSMSRSLQLDDSTFLFKVIQGQEREMMSS